MLDIRLQGVSKVYEGNAPAVDNIDLEVEHGSLMTLLGPSGCGKTTTLKMISGFEPVTAGDIFVAEERINDVPAYKRNVTTVFQNYALFPHMRVYQNVAYGLVRRRIARDQIRERTQRMLEVVGLEKFAARYPAELSGGQQQRVALARSLVLQPKVILLDEPLSNLDAKLRKRMEVEIRNILLENNVTAIHVTHDQEEALTMSDLVAVMNSGKIEQVGTPAEIYRHPVNRWVAEFIGISNMLPLSEVRPDGAGCIRATLPGNGEIRSLAPEELPRGAESWLMIRPEAVRVRSGPSADSAEVNRIKGKVVSTLYLGRCTRLDVAVAGAEAPLVVDVAEVMASYVVGDEIELEWDAEASWVLTR